MSESIKGEILCRGMWQIPYKAINVLCSDGKRRTAKITSEFDTFYSIPASVQVKGKTVAGFIMSKDDGDIVFAAYQYRKNAYLLPEQGEQVMTHTFTCDRCNQVKTHTDSISTGYGTTTDGKKHCFACCGETDKEYMDTHKRITLYLTEKDGQHYVTNWPSTLSYKTGHVQVGRHNIAGKRYDVWFRDYQGKCWHGTQYGDNTQLCHCKQVKG